jgi:hypothetical protein
MTGRGPQSATERIGALAPVLYRPRWSWHDIRISTFAGHVLTGEQMGEVVQFPKPDPDRERARLIREARSLYESIFPTQKMPAGIQPDAPAS